MVTAILFIVMMLVLIAPHELGHFIAAKLVGVKVNEFAIGMGPLIWQKQIGETKYSLHLLPIGGYNAMEGEDASSDDPRGFNNQGPAARIAILVAGVAMNVLIALLVCIITVQVSGVPVNTLGKVEPNSPAASVGLMAGDRIVSVNGTATNRWEETTEIISAYDRKGEVMKIVVNRDGREMSKEVVPVYNDETGRYMIGITAAVSRNPIRCLRYGAEMTWNLNKALFKSFGMIFRGEFNRKDVSGPVGLVKVVDETASYGAQSYLMLLALVSLNLAVLNLLPIPALDGGKILFVLLKLISRGRITDDMETQATMIGFALLLLLIGVITMNDIRNILGY